MTRIKELKQKRQFKPLTDRENEELCCLELDRAIKRGATAVIHHSRYGRNSVLPLNLKTAGYVANKICCGGHYAFNIDNSLYEYDI